MKRLLNQKMSVLSLLLILSSCASDSSPKVSSNTLVKNESVSLVHFAPDIPFAPDQAFFPLERDLSGVYYSWNECEKRFVVCLKWKHKKVSFKFNDTEAMKYFKAGDFGLTKRANP